MVSLWRAFTAFVLFGSALSGSTFTVYVVYCYGSHSWFTVGFFEGV